MFQRATTLLLTTAMALGLGTTASLAGQNAGAKILLHLLPVTTKNACGSRGVVPCSSANVNGQVGPYYYAYLVVADGNATAGLGGLQCGINYPQYTGSGGGIAVYSWTLCATLEFTSTGWPNSGGGNLITWDTLNRCQRTEPAGTGTGVVAAAGYFYLGAYSAGSVSITPRPVDGRAKVGDCETNEDLVGGIGFPSGNPSQLGILGFGGASSYRPCGLIVPTRGTTWSGIKGAYAN